MLPLLLSALAAAPAEAVPVTYRVGTASAECQASFDQGLAALCVRRWPDAARAFETATRQDARCAMAWWGLSRALDGLGDPKQADALKHAQELLPGVGDRERLLITARLQDKGLLSGGRRAAAKSIDELLTLYDDDELAWYERAGYADGDLQRLAYWKALQRLNPRHPAANFELEHFAANGGKALAVLLSDDFRPALPGVWNPPGPVAPAEPPKATNGRMPFSNLAPARPVRDLCVYRYRVSTRSPECQAFVDQGFGYLYSYVWNEAARSFETALRYDPDCAMAWWGLSRSLEKWSKPNHTQALEHAQRLLSRATVRERLLIIARLQEKGMWPGVAPDRRRAEAARTLDELLAVYGDDEEGWYARAEVADGGGTARVVYFKALLRINPLHPGGNHELVHFYDNYKRPALGMVYAESYIRSSPGLPHAFHMQAHLATRLGRWDQSTAWSARAVELEKAYHKEMNVSPKDDYQYSHHLEILTRSLVHDGRFAEARACEKEGRDLGYRFLLPWFRLHLAERNYAEAMKVVDQYRRNDRGTASYLAALVYLQQGDTARAATEVEALKKAAGGGRGGRNEAQVWEVEGWLKCQQGDADAGLALLARAADRLKNDYGHHAWGEGAYYMESWGIAALQAGKDDAAEEAFLEALAHDPGSVRGALGLQILCERQGRTQEAGRYAELARKCWKKADPGALDAELAALRERRPAEKP